MKTVNVTANRKPIPIKVSLSSVGIAALILELICNAIVTGIVSGVLNDGDPLPSVRSLAAEIGVNLHTVNKAYRLLQNVGIIKIFRNHGTFVYAGGAPRNAALFLEQTGKQPPLLPCLLFSFLPDPSA